MDLSFSSDNGTIYILFLILALPIFILFPLVQKIISVFKQRKILKSQTIIALYESPQGLSPAEIGYMYDSTIGKKEIVGTLLDLEYRGLVAIDQGGGLTVTDKVHGELKQHETLLCRFVQQGELKNISSHIDPQTTHVFNQAVRTALIEQGFMNKSLFMGYLKKILQFTLLIAPSTVLIVTILYLMFGNFASVGDKVFAFFFLNIVSFFVGFPVYAITGTILTLMYVEIYGTYWIGTKKLRSIWRGVEGFKVYIQQAQLDRLRFTSQDLKEQSKERDYGYAVALGMDLNWKTRFSK